MLGTFKGHLTLKIKKNETVSFIPDQVLIQDSMTSQLQVIDVVIKNLWKLYSEWLQYENHSLTAAEEI
jgi:hypothetical protein